MEPARIGAAYAMPSGTPISMRLVCATLAFAVAACSGVPARRAAAPSCEAGDQAMVRDTLYFGRNVPGGGAVTDAQWQAFLDDTVTPRFPGGLTVVEATGQWRGTDGRMETEASQVVTLLHQGDAASRRAITAIVREYKRRFMQEAVLRERVAACVEF